MSGAELSSKLLLSHDSHMTAMCTDTAVQHQPSLLSQQPIHTFVKYMGSNMGVYSCKGVVQDVDRLVLVHRPSQGNPHLLPTTECDTVLSHLSLVPGRKNK